MSFMGNQQNNWAYVLVIVIWAFIVGGFAVYYSVDTVEEINSLQQER